MSGVRVMADQETETRIVGRIESRLWDGMAEVGRIEIVVARHLDPRVSIRVLRVDSSQTGPVEVSMV